ncbi:MAG TPA: hypothetical protein VN842_00005 [Thermoplasmata archaeon]|nr:hypothetical protein [Thermoplasmata archaeon]
MRGVRQTDVLAALRLTGAVVVAGTGPAVQKFINEVEERDDPDLRLIYVKVATTHMRIVPEGP